MLNPISKYLNKNVLNLCVSEGLEPKGLSPPHKKNKAKKPECLKDSSEGKSCFSFL